MRTPWPLALLLAACASAKPPSPSATPSAPASPAASRSSAPSAPASPAAASRSSVSPASPSLAAASPVATPSTPTPAVLAWPVAPGWRAETLPFPLDFAPTLAHRGVEELRFAPRFFEPTSPTYFSYAFAWLVDDAPSFDAAALETELTIYFAGLAHAVAPARFEAGAHRAALARAGDVVTGTVETVDAFGDGRALRLHVAGDVRRCAGGRTALVLGLSPRADEEMAALLARERRALRCS